MLPSAAQQAAAKRCLLACRVSLLTRGPSSSTSCSSVSCWCLLMYAQLAHQDADQAVELPAVCQGLLSALLGVSRLVTLLQDGERLQADAPFQLEWPIYIWVYFSAVLSCSTTGTCIVQVLSSSGGTIC